jgi:hypothetical protein
MRNAISLENERNSILELFLPSLTNYDLWPVATQNESEIMTLTDLRKATTYTEKKKKQQKNTAGVHP